MILNISSTTPFFPKDTAFTAGRVKQTNKKDNKGGKRKINTQTKIQASKFSSTRRICFKTNNDKQTLLFI